MKTHTPGPWAVYYPEKGGFQIVCKNSGPSYNRILAEVTQIGSGREHNARLIAAAPEMLDALKEVLRHLDCPDGAQGKLYSDALSPHSDDRTILECLKEIVKKAEGD